MTDPTNPSPVLAEGTKIGGCYVLRQNLSKPGESPVWLASDEVLGKDVTLHFVPPAVAADARAMTELRQEVKRNRQLIHPNILRVYDFVEDGGAVAISMDTFEGESLQSILQSKGRLDPADMKPWIAQLGETLADAHRIQLFHRDLSPENIYLRPNGGLLVANFGVSRVMLNALERAGLRKGAEARLAFVSPQQIDGDRPAASDDIYGFGVLMHLLLGGTPPFGGEDLVPQIRKTAPDPISVVRAAAGANAPVPGSWEKLIASCLEKTPEARPRNLADVLTLLGQESAPARPRAAAEPVVAKTAAPISAGLDAPLKTPEHSEKSAAPAAAAALAAAAVPAPEKAAVSSPPLHPEIPPIGPGGIPRKEAAKGAFANFPELERPRSKAPLVWLALAAGIIGVGIYLRNPAEPAGDETDGAVARLDATGNPPENSPRIAASDANSGDQKSLDALPDPVPVKTAKVVANDQAPAGAETAKTAAATPPKAAKPGGLIGSDAAVAAVAPPENLVPEDLAHASAADGAKNPPANTPPAVEKGLPVSAANAHGAEKRGHIPAKAEPLPPPPTPAPALPRKTAPLPALPAAFDPLPKLALPEAATAAQLDEAKKQREAAMEKIRKTAADADAVHEQATRRLDAAKTEKDQRQKSFEAKRKALMPVIQQADAVEVERKKAEADAAKAQTAAADAAKAADAARQKLESVVAKGGEKLKARKQAEEELSAETAEISGLAKESDELSQVLTKADAIRKQARLSQQQAEQDLQSISASTERVRRTEMEALRKANEGKLAALEKQVQDLQAQIARWDATIEGLKDLGEEGKPAVAKLEAKKSAAQKQIGDLQAEAKRLSTLVPSSGTEKTTGTAKPPVAPPVPVAPDKTPVASKETAGATNSLGMKFAPVGDLQFSVYLTTLKDFEGFASATGLKSEAWRNPGFKQGPDHPVVNVTWREAEAFCKWLTEKERKAGALKNGEAYRLPTDLEWSKAVGLPAENGATPEDRDMGVQDVYPWGNQWPPPAGAGNYAGEETQTEIPIPNYNDTFPNTSPVGKFRANAAGLYDMGGNVWQWVADFWNGENRLKTLRGGSWYNGAIPLSLLSSCRISSSPDTLHDTYGFRVVKAIETGKPRRR